MRVKLLGLALGLTAVVAFVAASGTRAPAAATPVGASRVNPHYGLSNLQHLIFVVQENRSFDSYFGTYPGADGFPNPLPCLPSKWYPSQCFTPFPDHAASNGGGPYDAKEQVADIDNGKMDGFLEQAEIESQTKFKCPPPNRMRRGEPVRTFIDDDEEMGPQIKKCTIDVLGYHDGTDLPNYWSYAANFTLQDHFFESTFSSSHPAHLELFSLWTAKCQKLSPPEIGSCSANPDPGQIWSEKYPMPYLWTDLTYLLNQNGVSWKAYLDGGLGGLHGNTHVPTLFDVLPGFETVQEDGQVGNAENYSDVDFYHDAAYGTLPQVSWLLPDYKDSEHPQASIAHGQAYLTNVINAVMAGPDWSSSAIFVVHDDIGGFYDHEPPPYNLDGLGLGVRVPALIVSPWVKPGYIDSQVCSTDCYAIFIEDVFMKGERLVSAGRADPRTVYRDQVTQYGDLANDFDFSQAPRPPLFLRPYPMSLLR